MVYIYIYIYICIYIEKKYRKEFIINNTLSEIENVSKIIQNVNMIRVSECN